MLLRKKIFQSTRRRKNNILIPEMLIFHVLRMYGTSWSHGPKSLKIFQRRPISSGWQHQAFKKKKFSGSAGSTQTAV